MTTLSNGLQIMGVMNITPDSFSDGGNLMTANKPDLDKVIDQAALMVAEGVDWLDVGGESTRPGAKVVSVDEELDRVIPVIEVLRSRFDRHISVDTSQPEVMKQAATQGADMINDVRALCLDGALSAAAESGMAVCLMHMQGSPESMQNNPNYQSVVEQVDDFLNRRIEAAEGAGIAPEKICIDPGFGFGKTLFHNIQLLEAIPRLCEKRYPVLVGFSRKSMIGHMTGRAEHERDVGTTVLNTIALQKGATLFRVHNVAAAADMVKIFRAIDAEQQTNNPKG